MIKKYFFLFVILLTCHIAKSQHYFEGKITYKFNFESEKVKDPNKILTAVLGTGSTLFFKEGNYRHEFQNGILEYDIYNKEDNKMYVKKRNNDTIYWTDCSKADNHILDSTFTSTTDTTLGIICNKFEIHYKEGSQVDYYNSDTLSINPDWFKKYKLEDEYLIDQREKAIYLKSEHSYPYFKLIETATEIRWQPIDKTKFKIPKNSILVKQY